MGKGDYMKQGGIGGNLIVINSFVVLEIRIVFLTL